MTFGLQRNFSTQSQREVVVKLSPDSTPRRTPDVRRRRPKSGREKTDKGKSMTGGGKSDLRGTS